MVIMGSKVYHADALSDSMSDSIAEKAVKLLYDAGLEGLFSKGQTVAVKAHMGAAGDSAGLRPQWVSAVVEEIKKLGGKPVLLDCLPISHGKSYAHITKSEYMDIIKRNGFCEESMGCPVCIADGDEGFGEVKVDVPHGVIMEHTYLGEKFTSADACIVLSHFTGHELLAYSGAIFNIGYGMASKHGKITNMLMNHETYGISNLSWNQVPAKQASHTTMTKKVTGAVFKEAEEGEMTVLDEIIESCHADALEWHEDRLDFYKDKCKNCGECFYTGYFSGVLHPNPEMYALLPSAVADAASAYVNTIGRDKMIFVNYAVDISLWSDEMAFHTPPMLPDLGVFASKDPVALDMACLEMAEAMPCTDDSPLKEVKYMDVVSPGTERFTYGSNRTKVSQWAQANAGAYNGLGSAQYVLEESKPCKDCRCKKERRELPDFGAGVYYHEQPELSLIEMFVKPLVTKNVK